MRQENGQRRGNRQLGQSAHNDIIKLLSFFVLSGISDGMAWRSSGLLWDQRCGKCINPAFSGRGRRAVPRDSGAGFCQCYFPDRLHTYCILTCLAARYWFLKHYSNMRMKAFLWGKAAISLFATSSHFFWLRCFCRVCLPLVDKINSMKVLKILPGTWLPLWNVNQIKNDLISITHRISAPCRSWAVTCCLLEDRIKCACQPHCLFHHPSFIQCV